MNSFNLQYCENGSSLRDRDREQKRKYYLQNREAIIEKSRIYREKNRERNRQNCSRNYAANREARIIQVKKHRLENIEKYREKERKYYLDNRERILANSVKRQFGLSPEQHRALLEKQKGVCAICRKPERAKLHGRVRALAVDHCHKGKHVRGLLCSNCNTAIGRFKHSIQTLKNALKYLEKETLFNHD